MIFSSKFSVFIFVILALLPAIGLKSALLDCIDYHHDVIIEHMHYMNGKSEADAQYHEVNSSEVGNHDADEFRRYMEEEMKDDAIKVLTAVLK